MPWASPLKNNSHYWPMMSLNGLWPMLYLKGLWPKKNVTDCVPKGLWPMISTEHVRNMRMRVSEPHVDGAGRI